MVLKNISKKHIILFFVLLALVALFWLSTRFYNLFFGALSQIEEYLTLHPLLGVIAFVVLAVFSAMFLFFSSIVLLPAAILIWGKTLTFILLLTGWAFGGVIAYIIGKYLGRRVLTLFISEERLRHYEHLVSSRTNVFLMFFFRLFAPSEILGYLFGIIRYRFFDYFVITVIAEAPFAWGAVYATEVFMEQRFLWFVSFILLAAGVFYWLQRRFHQSLKKQEYDQ